jgi:SAM-dependent methyltransferase
MRRIKNNNTNFDRFNKNYYTTDGYNDYMIRFEEEGKDVIKRLIKIIEPDTGWCFLDVGCGMGGTILALRKLGYKAWGTEVSIFCLENSPARKWMRFGEASNIKYEDSSFEVVICSDVLCYLTKSELVEAAKELVRVTKHYLYVESICKGSPNGNQKGNPDNLRDDRNLLTASEIKRIFESNDTLFLEPIYSKKESKDFNGIFVK